MSVVLTGNFDGLHIGHMSLVLAAKALASAKIEPLYVYTFENNPKNYLIDKNLIPNIILPRDRDALLLENGVDRVFSVIFDGTFADMSADEYLCELQTLYGCSCIVCGENFRFGKNAECGNENILDYTSRHGIDCRVVPMLKLLNGENISSTVIRTNICNGNLEVAAEMLGRYFYIKGEVVYGRHDGTAIGFPTLNTKPAASIIMPRRGVYETVTYVDGLLWHSMTNVGTAPTLSDKGEFIVETNLIRTLDGLEPESVNVYGCTALIQFVRYIRPEIYFKSSEQLSLQLNRDRLNVLNSQNIKYDKIVRI